MTDEEQKKLCERLRRLELERDVGVKAADEIERLAEELRITNKALSMCSDECNRVYEKYYKKLDEIERLNPPRPDASTGLIEAAEMADEEAAKTDGLKGWELMKFAKLLRARAADRSGK